MARTIAAGRSMAAASSVHLALRVLMLGVTRLPLASAIPLSILRVEAPEAPKSPNDLSLWAFLGTAFALVVLGGVFAGLTIALMGQDEIYLQVIATSGEGKEREHAQKVLQLLKRGKHWVLVTLLLSNVITNETLPVILDRSIGGGWPAVLSSTILIVIFGEVIPQSICVRYGLPIGAWMSDIVLVLMWIMSPVAWPTAKLLDYLLGTEHKTAYKKAGLKTLVTLHRTLGTSPDERLNKDEVTIISAVLDLKEKPVGSIMTPIEDVFTLSANAVLDDEMMDRILTAGYSRIPIYAPDHPQNYVGMLLVKMLITYDPEDAIRVRDFSLATLPETRPETSCLDIVNFFQEGKSHMVLVSDYPGEPYGALGVVTLEDVIEELIGEEIIDESDVFVDVHKAIRRMAPAPRSRIPKGEVVTAPEPGTHTKQEDEIPVEGLESSLLNRSAIMDSVDGANGTDPRKQSLPDLSRSPRDTTLYMRRRKSADANQSATIPVKSSSEEVRAALKHLGPSNLASAPKQTKINTVKIKPGNGVSTIPEDAAISPSQFLLSPEPDKKSAGASPNVPISAGRSASDAVHLIQQVQQPNYGTLASSPAPKTEPLPSPDDNGKDKASADDKQDTKQHDGDHLYPYKERSATRSTGNLSTTSGKSGKIIIPSERPPSQYSNHSTSTLGGLKSPLSPSSDEPPPPRTTARSGSITENLVDAGGMKKMVLDLQPGESDVEAEATGEPSSSKQPGETQETSAVADDDKKKGNAKKKRKKRPHKKKGKDGSAESQPLLKH
ncbi:DUF21-domain-containing protein [Eremomyces bilateralis CBS 781.70]|uniref:DUF21-domain-containing protein n=1 Tax=Eremomyces bilateralis CBS 781.70 TaxID=1392243 RepID=A0A6G1G6G1_9PEZI|nr:DUF21-domain-containing protein [Eremomyces bilateralis CBS 781.70]KAF1813470.1 DUF21-domain-containing protein [Eremomyces bilateralis CBS 781.70]